MALVGLLIIHYLVALQLKVFSATPALKIPTYLGDVYGMCKLVGLCGSIRSGDCHRNFTLTSCGIDACRFQIYTLISPLSGSRSSGYFDLQGAVYFLHMT